MMETIMEEEICLVPTQSTGEGKDEREEEVIAKLTGALLITSLSNNNNSISYNSDDNENNNKENEAKTPYEAFLAMYR